MQIKLTEEDVERLQTLITEYVDSNGPFSEETTSGKEWISFLSRLDDALYNS